MDQPQWHYYALTPQKAREPAFEQLIECHIPDGQGPRHMDCWVQAYTCATDKKHV
jgi:hypothetical protein